LASLADGPGPLEEVLAELQAHEIIERRALVPESVYRFTHAILQEVAYTSLLHQQRQTFHTTVGEALERLSAERRTEQAAALAHHYWQGAHWSKARDYSALAGQRALAAYANAEAQAQYARAVQAAQRAPDTAPQAAARLHANHGKALMILAAYDAAAAAYAHARALMQQAGDRRGEIDILLDLSTVYTNTHAFGATPAREAIAQALAMARLLPDPACLADCLAHRVRVLTRGFGQLIEAMPEAEEALTLARDAGNPQRLAETLVALGRLLQWRGDFPRGLALLHEGATLAQQCHAGFLFGQAAFFLGNAYTATGRYAEAWQWYQHLRAYADTAGDRYWMARVPNTIGGLYLELFDLEAALQLTLEGDEVAQQCSPWSEIRGHALVKAGLAYLLRSEPHQAELCLRRATALLETDIWMRWRWHIPLLRLGRDQEAATVYGQALQTIEAIVATLWTPQGRRTFLRAAPVLEVYVALGKRPALVSQ
jgi:tetratricopeptide (TPR) repeat protein